MYTYTKHAIELVEHAKVIVLWDIYDPKNVESSQRYFEAYEPIVFIYKNNELVGAAYYKFDEVKVIDLNGRDVTSTYNKLVLKEIDTELKQLVLF